MKLKNKLKEYDTLRRFVKRIKNYREFLSDANDFSNNYEEVAESNDDYRYRLMLYIHNLEKGMCYENPRPFGLDKIVKIIEILKKASEEQLGQFEYQLSISVLKAWNLFYKERGWSVERSIANYIEDLIDSNVQAGSEIVCKPDLSNTQFEEVVFSRRSVRDFVDLPIRGEDLDFAIQCFIATPTACNRQMCKLYFIKNTDYKQLLSETILGIGGFNVSNVSLFLITYDVAAFEFYGERNQGYVNVGLTAMNFVNGLQARGIGSCFMQWSNNRTDDTIIRKKLGIPDSERIGIVVGAGYYKDETIIPKSTRKPKELVYKAL